MAESQPAQLIVAGRSGYNETLNGVYNRGEKEHDGKVYYQHATRKFVIRWYSTKKVWFFDHRGLNSDHIACAAAKENTAGPHQVTKIWRVYDGSQNRWVRDPNVTIQTIDEVAAVLKQQQEEGFEEEEESDYKEEAQQEGEIEPQVEPELIMSVVKTRSGREAELCMEGVDEIGKVGYLRHSDGTEEFRSDLSYRAKPEEAVKAEPEPEKVVEPEPQPAEELKSPEVEPAETPAESEPEAPAAAEPVAEEEVAAAEPAETPAECEPEAPATAEPVAEELKSPEVEPELKAAEPAETPAECEPEAPAAAEPVASPQEAALPLISTEEPEAPAVAEPEKAAAEPAESESVLSPSMSVYSDEGSIVVPVSSPPLDDFPSVGLHLTEMSKTESFSEFVEEDENEIIIPKRKFKMDKFLAKTNSRQVLQTEGLVKLNPFVQNDKGPKNRKGKKTAA